MLSWRGLAILVSFLLLFVEAFDPDLKTPLDQYANANCGGGGVPIDYDYDYDDKGNFEFLDIILKYYILKYIEEVCEL